MSIALNLPPIPFDHLLGGLLYYSGDNVPKQLVAACAPTINAADQLYRCKIELNKLLSGGTNEQFRAFLQKLSNTPRGYACLQTALPQAISGAKLPIEGLTAWARSYAEDLPNEGAQQKRLYQQKMRRDIIRHLIPENQRQAHPWQAVKATMQTGKTYLIGDIVKDYRRYRPKDEILIIAAHNIAKEQILAQLKTQLGAVSTNIRVKHPSVLQKELHLLRRNQFGLIILDETFSHQAPIYQTILKYLGVADADPKHPLKSIPLSSASVLLGFSATGLGIEHFHTVAEFNIIDALDEGWIRDFIGESLSMRGKSKKKRTQHGWEVWWEPTEPNARRIVNEYETAIYGRYRQNLIYAPTTQHAELLRKELNRRFGPNYSREVHSRIESSYENSLEESQNHITDWQAGEVCTLVAVGMLNTSFRGKGCGAILHTYQTESMELFVQRCGRGWAQDETQILPPLYILELVWQKDQDLAHLTKLFGLEARPATGLNSNKIRQYAERKIRLKECEAEAKRKVVGLEDTPSGEDFTPYIVSLEWRHHIRSMVAASGLSFTDICRITGLERPQLNAMYFGYLPTSAQPALALQRLFSETCTRESPLAAYFAQTEDPLTLQQWIKGWQQVHSDYTVGIRPLDELTPALAQWVETTKNKTFLQQAQTLETLLNNYSMQDRVRSASGQVMTVRQRTFLKILRRIAAMLPRNTVIQRPELVRQIQKRTPLDQQFSHGALNGYLILSEPAHPSNYLHNEVKEILAYYGITIKINVIAKPEQKNERLRECFKIMGPEFKAKRPQPMQRKMFLAKAAATYSKKFGTAPDQKWLEAVFYQASIQASLAAAGLLPYIKKDKKILPAMLQQAMEFTMSALQQDGEIEFNPQAFARLLRYAYSLHSSIEKDEVSPVESFKHHVEKPAARALIKSRGIEITSGGYFTPEQIASYEARLKQAYAAGKRKRA